MFGIILFSWFDYTRARYGDKIYPIWADFLGWMMTLVSLGFIPGTVIYLIFKERKINPYHVNTLNKLYFYITFLEYRKNIS